MATSASDGGTRPTMTDVAAAAGVSLKTVSRVVNAEPGVTDETAARVREAIELLGFRRNYVARALRRGLRFRMLGLVIEDVGNPFYSAIARGVEEVTRERGLLLLTGSSDEDPARERELARVFCERRVDGLLVVPAGEDHRYLLPELRAGMHAVFIDRPPGNIEADAVLLDNVGGARQAADHLVGRGHRRIAMVVDHMAIFTQRERWRGFCDALAAAGAPIDDTLVRFGVHDTVAAEQATAELLSLASPPTAVFAANNRITIGVLRALAAHGSDLEVVGFDDVELAELLARPLTTVSYDTAELGRRAAELLAQRLEGDASPPQRVILPTTLLVRSAGEVLA
ncbi:MAG TPA: LacI family DNA-binding transcriptional regulator [Gaiellaceae bacterium]